MFTIRTLDNISTGGLERFPRAQFEVASEIEHPDAILLRSYIMHSFELPKTLKAVARAGAGYNNIPIDRCTERGIVVFNTPGANANSVKELVIAGMLLSSRGIVEGINWSRAIKEQDVAGTVEKGKKQFVGPEIAGKRLGVVGLGAVGVLVANDAASLGMDVSGYDPFISIESAWGLSRNIRRASHLDELLTEADYISLHIPLTEKTTGYINQDKFERMKRGVRILNFARGGLVDNGDLIKAMDQGLVARYVTDFPEDSLIRHKQVIPVPHLGASTPEAEVNCAVMAADQLVEFLKTGNVKNSVNFPSCDMALSGDYRIVIANKNIPNMVGQITTILAEDSINISDMLNRHRGDYAYNIIDVEGAVTEETLGKLKGINGVIMVRLIEYGKE